MKLERELMRGAAPTAVMQVLSGGEKYGYELVESLTRQSNGLLGIGQSTLYPLLYNLEAKGLVERVRDEADRRRVLVQMTEEGMRSTYAMYAPLVDEGQGLFAAHTVAELAAMRDLLEAMREMTDRHRESILRG